MQRVNELEACPQLIATFPSARTVFAPALNLDLRLPEMIYARLINAPGASHSIDKERKLS